MTYVITWTRGDKRVTLRSFAGMVLWASDSRWQWTVGKSVEKVIAWVSDPPGKRTRFGQIMPAMRWSVSE